MKVALLVRQYYPSMGGLENFVASLAQALRRNGAEPDIFTLNRVFSDASTVLPSHERIDNIAVTRWPFVGFQRFFAPQAAPEALSGYDIVHVHGVDGMFELVARMPRRRGQALIATTHGLFFHTRWLAPLKQAYFRAITARQCRRYDGIIANSSADAALVSAHNAHVRVIPNGVDPLAPATATGSRLLTVGRIAPHKRVELLIDALAQPALRDAHLDVAGPEWGVKIASLRAHAAELGVAHRVVFHGALSRDDLAALALRAGVFVSASAYEGFGMAMVEAMGAGLVPVVHANASFQELLGGAGIGALVDFSYAGAAAEAIAAASNALNPAQRERAIAFARRYSWREHARETLAFYRDALERANVLRRVERSR